MKFLLLFFIFMVFAWQWRHAREEKVKNAMRKPGAPGGIVNMVPCAQCGVHLPAGDAIQGKHHALYCSVAHRQAREP
jgi:uncharacterized protein